MTSIFETYGAQTLIFDAYSAWLELVTAALPPNVSVLDGPTAGIPTDTDVFLVGVDDATAGGMITAIDQAAQATISLGAHDRDESFVIHNTLVVWTGNNDPAEVRSRARAYIQALGIAVRPLPHGVGDGMLNGTLNQDGRGTGWCGLTSVAPMRQITTAQGPALHVAVDLGCFARI